MGEPGTESGAKNGKEGEWGTWKFLTSQTWGFVVDFFFMIDKFVWSGRTRVSGFAVTGFVGDESVSSRKRAPTLGPLVLLPLKFQLHCFFSG